ncbi:hypothetical protein IGS68_34705 (plasmid) [Skermanella sp. TT6]|uniref:Uncharacterized protein n=1 Tax=Skermanella cutis TaxID=2775420 RepID=A0ABX7BI30_9PROT|nr:hypothetical protein [Skermanella sp. TT6]QQP93997.1 hypothetical protein IGS68_34705 [Skermanella sp. TT6]
MSAIRLDIPTMILVASFDRRDPSLMRTRWADESVYPMILLVVRLRSELEDHQ